MARVKFNSLKCIRKQDVTGSDEPHIWVNGVDKWNFVMKKGETEVLATKQYEADFKDEVVKVELKEWNPGGQKSLGTVTISDGQETSPAVFKTSGAHYELEYDII